METKSTQILLNSVYGINLNNLSQENISDIEELAIIHGEVLEKMMIEINRLKFGGNEKIHIQL